LSHKGAPEANPGVNLSNPEKRKIRLSIAIHISVGNHSHHKVEKIGSPRRGSVARLVINKKHSAPSPPIPEARGGK
jgi:hypothetical protein